MDLLISNTLEIRPATASFIAAISIAQYAPVFLFVISSPVFMGVVSLVMTVSFPQYHRVSLSFVIFSSSHYNYKFNILLYN